MPFTSETAIYGGKKPGAGRPPKKKQQIEKAAAEIAREFIEQNVQPILSTYIGLAAGQVIERETGEGKKYFTLSVDPPTTRHAVDKLLPEIAPDANQRPIAIQVIVEGSAAHAPAQSQGNGRPIFAIGSNGDES